MIVLSYVWMVVNVNEDEGYAGEKINVNVNGENVNDYRWRLCWWEWSAAKTCLLSSPPSNNPIKSDSATCNPWWRWWPWCASHTPELKWPKISFWSGLHHRYWKYFHIYYFGIIDYCHCGSVRTGVVSFWSGLHDGYWKYFPHLLLWNYRLLMVNNVTSTPRSVESPSLWGQWQPLWSPAGQNSLSCLARIYVSPFFIPQT